MLIVTHLVFHPLFNLCGSVLTVLDNFQKSEFGSFAGTGRCKLSVSPLWTLSPWFSALYSLLPAREFPLRSTRSLEATSFFQILPASSSAGCSALSRNFPFQQTGAREDLPSEGEVQRQLSSPKRKLELPCLHPKFRPTDRAQEDRTHFHRGNGRASMSGNAQTPESLLASTNKANRPTNRPTNRRTNKQTSKTDKRKPTGVVNYHYRRGWLQYFTNNQYAIVKQAPCYSLWPKHIFYNFYIALSFNKQ